MTKAVAVQEALTLEETRAHLHDKLKGIVPGAEIELKAELAFKINRLKAEKNAVILGHNYMEPALYHSVPDHVGDSLALARESAETDADIIVFCGVQFMAETAKILNPEKTVLIPSDKAGPLPVFLRDPCDSTDPTGEFCLRVPPRRLQIATASMGR